MKIVVKKEEKKTAYKEVEFREPKVGDLLKAERISEEKEGVKYVAALVSVITTFDGKALLMEDILEFPAADFLYLKQGIEDALATVLVTE